MKVNQPLTHRPVPTPTDGSNPFAHHSMKVRVPRIIEETQKLNPDYPTPIQKALDELRFGIANNAPIPMLTLPAPDYDEWAALHEAHAGETWLNSEWFFAEVYSYRLLMQAVRWWETGRDPFAPKKDEEFASDALWQFLEVALSAEGEDRLAALLQFSLWGNRIDLSYAASLAHGSAWQDDDLIADDLPAAVDYLKSQHGTVHIVADNAGTELAADMALVDGLLQSVAQQVVFHIKVHPTFVSDSTVPDVLKFFRLASAHGGKVQALAERLNTASIEGRLRLAPDLFWDRSQWLWELPPRLTKAFEGASLVILKGDLNYRRAIGDALWEPETPFTSAVDYFPVPLLALRTLKSDPVVGLRKGMAKELDSLDKDWRVNGKRGVIQFVGK